MSTSGRSWGWRLGIVSWLAMGYAITISGDCAHAQVAPDSTLGTESSVVTPYANGIDVISGGATRDTNLFHSFQQFSVLNGREAFFNNAADIQNIISRVTGGSISNIDGLIRANGAANLFLINPNGIIFGPNATLSIGGSFLASTASSLNFADGTQFSATNPKSPPLLRVSVPIGLQYGGTAGDIQVQQSILKVQSGQTLALMGGDVSVEGGEFGFFEALGGRVELGGLAGTGMVQIEGQQSLGAFKLTSLRFPDSIELKDVSLTNLAYVNVAASGGGSIAINARNFNLSGQSNLVAGIEEGLGAVGSQVGDITLNAMNAVTVGQSSTIQNVIGLDGTGNGGDINIKAGGNVSVANSQILTNTAGQGDAGSVSVQANGSISIADNSMIDSSTTGQGDAGSVSVQADGDISFSGDFLGDFTYITSKSWGQGNAGSVSVQANGNVSFTNSTIFSDTSQGTGDAGSVSVQANGNISFADSSITSATNGQGNAGSISVQANGNVSLFGNYANSVISSGTFGQGKGGDIHIQARAFSLTDGSQVFAATGKSGNAGNIQIDAVDSVTLAGIGEFGDHSGLFTNTEEGASGQGGDITVRTGTLHILDRAVLSAITKSDSDGGKITANVNNLEIKGGGQLLTTAFSSGDAGNITVNATDSITISGNDPTYFDRLAERFGMLKVATASPSSGVFANTNANSIGNGGTIELNTINLSISDGASIGINSSGRGSAGNFLRINARDAVALDNSLISSSLGPLAVGQGGNIEIQTELLSLTNSAQAEAATFGQGDAGRISVRAADSVSLSDSSISTTALASAVGQGGNIDIQTGSLSLDNNARLSASTAGQGNAGDITLTAQNAVAVANSSTISSGVETGASGDGGSIDIQTQTFSLTNGAQINASTQGQEDADAGNISVSASRATIQGGSQVSATTSSGNGGNITVTANTFKATNGGQLLTTTAGSKRAGNITLAVLDSVTLVGAGSGLFANTTPGSTGDGGSIFIDPRIAIIEDDAGIAVGNQGTGIGGDIRLLAGSLTLDDRAFLSAETASNQGGNIALEIQDLFLLRRGSQISVAAGTAQAGGDGGNITIWVPFIVAVPSENSDISANAFTGNGGKVEITASGIFGIQFREQQTPESDITASSTGGGINGVVTINTPDVDPSRGLVNLPAELVDASNQIAQSCPGSGRQGESKFIVTGRGGLPPNPSKALSGDAIQVDWVTLKPGVENRSSPPVSTNPTAPAPAPIVEAQGWVINNKGEVVLTATAPTATPHIPWLTQASCHTPETSS